MITYRIFFIFRSIAEEERVGGVKADMKPIDHIIIYIVSMTSEKIERIGKDAACRQVHYMHMILPCANRFHRHLKLNDHSVQAYIIRGTMARTCVLSSAPASAGNFHTPFVVDRSSEP